MNEQNIVIAVRQAVGELLDERSRRDAETHRRHHQFIVELIAREERRKQLCQKLTEFLSQWALGALIVWAIWKTTGVKIEPPW